MRLEDRVAIVTGASRGIGEAIAIGLAREGAHVVLAARTLEALDAVGEKIRALGREALAISTDVSDEESVKNMVDQAVEHFGRIDILVNNAGGGMWKPVYATSLNTWEWLIGVNLRGPFLCIKHVWKTMQEIGGGSIINIGSTSGSRSYALMAAYSASKWGLVGLTKSCAEEGKIDNIRVNIINPGKVNTEFRSAAADKEEVMEAEDIVGATIFLASDEANHIHGQVIEMDATINYVPRRRDRNGEATANK